MPATCEVFGLFSHLIPQEGLSRLDRARERQGMVPDFMLEISDPTGTKVNRLAELNVINCCLSHYPLGGKYKAVDWRAGLFKGEYRREAREVDKNTEDRIPIR